MRIYVAGSTSDLDRVRRVQLICRDYGHSIIFDWTGSEGEIKSSDEWLWDKAHDKGVEISMKEVLACSECDLLILIAPPKGRGLGCYIEMGVALGNQIHVAVLQATRDSVFWHHPLVTRYDTFEELIRAELVQI